MLSLKTDLNSKVLNAWNLKRRLVITKQHDYGKVFWTKFQRNIKDNRLPASGDEA